MTDAAALIATLAVTTIGAIVKIANAEILGMIAVNIEEIAAGNGAISTDIQCRPI